MARSGSNPLRNTVWPNNMQHDGRVNVATRHHVVSPHLIFHLTAFRLACIGDPDRRGALWSPPWRNDVSNLRGFVTPWSPRILAEPPPPHPADFADSADSADFAITNDQNPALGQLHACSPTVVGWPLGRDQAAPPPPLPPTSHVYETSLMHLRQLDFEKGRGTSDRPVGNTKKTTILPTLGMSRGVH